MVQVMLRNESRYDNAGEKGDGVCVGGGNELVFHVYRVRSHNDAYLSLQGFKDSSKRKHVASAHLHGRSHGIKTKITKRSDRSYVFVVRCIEFHYSNCMLSVFWIKG
jgi:hypothetical protein